MYSMIVLASEDHLHGRMFAFIDTVTLECHGIGRGFDLSNATGDV